MTPFEEFKSDIEKVRKYFEGQREELNKLEEQTVDFLQKELKQKTENCKHQYAITSRMNWMSLEQVQVYQCKNCGNIK